MKTALLQVTVLMMIWPLKVISRSSFLVLTAAQVQRGKGAMTGGMECTRVVERVLSVVKHKLTQKIKE